MRRKSGHALEATREVKRAHVNDRGQRVERERVLQALLDVLDEPPQSMTAKVRGVGGRPPNPMLIAQHVRCERMRCLARFDVRDRSHAEARAAEAVPDREHQRIGRERDGAIAQRGLESESADVGALGRSSQDTGIWIQLERVAVLANAQQRSRLWPDDVTAAGHGAYVVDATVLRDRNGGVSGEHDLEPIRTRERGTFEWRQARIFDFEPGPRADGALHAGEHRAEVGPAESLVHGSVEQDSTLLVPRVRGIVTTAELDEKLIMSFVTSADGVRIAYEKLGGGAPIILVGGLLCARDALRELAERLARDFSVLIYDRRGRGESGDAPPYAVERELDDLRALLAAAGGYAAVYGHSSGGGLALRAAAAGLPITRLVLHEPPYGGNDEESRRSARHLAEQIRATLERGSRGEAVRLFFAAMGLPNEVVDELAGEPARRALAHTMTYDFEVMGEFEGGSIPADLVASITVPTLVLAGSASPDFFVDTSLRLASLLSRGALTMLEGQDHAAPAEAVAPTVASFLADGSAHEAAIRKLVRDWAASVRNKDLAGVLRDHSTDLLLIDVDLREVSVTAGSDVAFATAIASCASAADAEGKRTELEVRLTLGLRKLGRRWVLVHEHHSVPAT